jgi:sulfur relay (sulfurtransferase) complex TusBCD TusD component (DsrE family)
VLSGEGADEILEVICKKCAFRRGISKETIERVQSYLQQIYFVQINQHVTRVRN